jgi:probable HAF family extracellular repeat protein
MKPALAVLLSLVFQGLTCAGPLYRIVDLGPGAATGINSAGQISGWRQDHSGQSRGFWSDGTITREMTLAPGALVSTTAALNSSGQIAGTYWTASAAQAAVWSNGTITNLGTLGGTESYAMAINASGHVAGNSTTTAGNGHAFLYRDGVMQDLGVPAGAFWSSAYGLNDDDVAVGYSLGASGFQAFRWSSQQGFTSIGGANSYAMAINRAGAIAGHARSATGMLHAFLYASGGMTDLGTLGGPGSFAYGLNSSNSVVGYSSLAGGGTHAFLYLGAILYDLNTLIPASGWELTGAYSINDSGQIAGTGLFNGEMRAFRLDPASELRTVHNPEPATILLAGGALVLLWLRCQC